MNKKVYRKISEPLRNECSWEELWLGDDAGLITCWEVGRSKAISDPELALKATNNELPVLGWKGGVEKKLKVKEKYGSLNYLAQWQGLRGENLKIDPTNEVTMKCSRTDMIVIYTPDREKYSNS